MMRADGIVKRYESATGIETTMVTSNVLPGANARRTATDDSHLYVTGRYHKVLRFPMDGGVDSHEALATTENGTDGVFVTADANFLTYSGQVGRVVKIAK